MTPKERALFLIMAALYALLIAVGALATHEVLPYLPHVAILAGCCVAVPAMLRRLHAPPKD